MSLSSLAERLAQRFAGLSRSHGTYALGAKLSADDRGKLTGPRKTVHEPVTVELWEKHIAGTYGLGIVPIRTDNTVVFGAIDIDDYTLDLKALNARIQAASLPLILCRTKSGGAHLYCFSAVPVSAEAMRTKLVEWAIYLGHPGVEVFPKQVTLARANDSLEDNTGNWINMPYAAGDRTLRYALDPATGNALSLEEFLDLADRRQVPDQATLQDSDPPQTEGDEFLEGGPPCLQTLAINGFPEGSRNNALFNFGVLCIKKYGEGYEAPLRQANIDYMHPPLSHEEVSDIVKSLRKKKYSYRCKDQPICGACNKEVCRERDFGIGGLPDDPGVTFGALEKIQTQPPTYIWEVNGHRIEMDADTVMNQRKLHVLLFQELDLWPNIIKPGKYKTLVSDCLSKLKAYAVPEDATREGQLLIHLGRFVNNRAAAKEMDEIILGKPFTNEKEGLIYFQSADFIQYLQQHRISGINETDIWKILRRKDAKPAIRAIKGATVKLWAVKKDLFTKQTEPYNTPRVALPDEM